MNLKGFYLLPHPPVALSEIGKGEEEKIRKTRESMYAIGQEIRQKAPKTIILITPHGPMFEDAVALSDEGEIYGDFKPFGAPSVSMKLPVNRALTKAIYEMAGEEKIPAVLVTKEVLSDYNEPFQLDHGAMVPLYFINEYYKDYELVHITYAPLDDISLYRFGMVIQRAAEKMGEQAVIIASGDLSHRLKKEGPYQYNPMGPKFDKEFLDLLSKGNALGVLNIDKETITGAGECGRRSVLILLGTLEGKQFNGELLSYEGTFGVGYGVMKFQPSAEGDSVLKKLTDLQKERQERKKHQKNPYVRLARESLTYYLETRKMLDTIPDYVTEEMKTQKRGVFVSLKKHGELRGCIGTIFPVTDCMAEEIIRNAVEAGIYDPRFREVEEEELLDIDFSVDVLTEPALCTRKDLDPKQYGVIVRYKGRSGLLLPDLEGVDTVEEQLAIALKKAGIDPDEPYTIEKFSVIRHKEE